MLSLFLKISGVMELTQPFFIITDDKRMDPVCGLQDPHIRGGDWNGPQMDSITTCLAMQFQGQRVSNIDHNSALRR